jgi:hypothetical protein
MEIKQLFKTNEQPIIINRLGNNNYIYTYVIETGNEDVIDVEGKTENKPYWVCTWVKLAGLPNYSDCVKGIIRNYYTAEEELNLINVGSRLQLGFNVSDDKLREYEDYLNIIDTIKSKVKKDFNIEEGTPQSADVVKATDIQKLIKTLANTVELSDTVSLEIKSVYPRFTDLIGQTVKVGTKLLYQDKLYKVIQEHLVQSQYAPGTGTESLYTEISESHTGTADDPIPYNNNMALENGKYYVQDGIVYKCTRDTINPVYNPLKDLVGLYVEVYNA